VIDMDQSVIIPIGVRSSGLAMTGGERRFMWPTAWLAQFTSLM